MSKSESLEIELMIETLNRGFNLSFRALGNSMRPFIISGNVITVQPTEPEKLSIGDVLLYLSEGKFYVHRLIRKYKVENQLFFITKGDNRQLQDPPILLSQILGKVIKIERGDRPYNAGSIPIKLSNYFISMIPLHLINQLANLRNKLNRIIST